MRKLIIFYLLAIYSFPSFANVGESGNQCRTNTDDFLAVGKSDDGIMDVQATDAQLVKEGVSLFTGDVEILRNGQELKSDRATYERVTGQVIATGNVQMRDSEFILNSKRAEWDTVKDRGYAFKSKYRLRTNHGRGKANQLYRQGVTTTTLKKATYTTCAEGNNAWLLKSSNVVLNHEKSVGMAKNLVVKVKGIPILYSPYMSFPLDDKRKSGFLTPTIGSNNESGMTVTTPYYWNISPNKDASFTPRYMSERGLMLDGEFRYLNKSSSGEINADFLASDSLEKKDTAENPYFNEDRKHFSAKHRGRLGARWSTDVDYNYVSDNAYLEDFGASLSLVSTTHINRHLNLDYSGDNWNFSGRLQGYQTLTNASKPYQRLPQLRINGSFPDKWMGLTYDIDSEYVVFDHATSIAGQRFNIEPSIRFPWTSAAAFITPRVALRHTRYDLDRSVNVGGTATPNRTIPISSVDSGLFFERDLHFLKSRYVQTLEPRAYYLYVPERDQFDIPIFDSGLRGFSMGQLFAYDRFSGVDRVGDANQLSLSLTSRIINQQTGKENIRLTVGQIQYFKDRVVALSSTSASDTQSDSDMVAEFVASLADEWTMLGSIQWDHHENSSNVSALQLRYKSENGRLLNIAHRYRRSSLEQADISARLPLNSKWSVVGRWYHALNDHRTLEGLAGVEYDSCCLTSRIVVRNFINSTSEQERNLAIFFQLELKGLGNFGQQTKELLDRSILGYGL